MRWKEQSRACRAYLVVTYVISVPIAIYTLGRQADFNAEWIILTLTSVFVATINVRLPKISAVVSMGDVFIILSLLRFGPAAALVTYWIDIIAAHLSDVVRKHGTRIRGKVLPHRLFFNLSCCALSICAMHLSLAGVRWLHSTPPLLLSLAVVALSWFTVNTTTVSLAISFWMNKGFWSVWQEGLNLYLLNTFGSAAAAGLIMLFYDRVGSSVFILAVPIAVVLFQLYSFYISKYEQAQKHIDELNQLFLQTIETLATAVDAKDRYTFGHIRRVQALAVELATCTGITDERDLMSIRAGALLHDIGKIAIPEYILNKPTSLTESEYEKMKLHPVVGTNMLKNIQFPYPVLPMVRSHHERWDGNGYPDRLRAEETPLHARILAIADCYDALTTNRPYRSPMARNELIEFFKKESGVAYDPAIIEVLVNNIDRIHESGQNIPLPDIWGIREAAVEPPAAVLRPLDKVQPIVTYGKALQGDVITQTNLFSVLEFARANIQCLSPKDVLRFMGSKLEELIQFDAGVFYVADLGQSTVVADYVIGRETEGLEHLSLPLEQKLSGWAAANNQSLCNLPPFPDFIHCSTGRPAFEISAIAPMNKSGTVWGAISLYRKERKKFTEEEFRRLELVAAQTAVALSNCAAAEKVGPLTDSLTGLPNGYQLQLVFDQVAIDAHKFDYHLAILSFRLEDVKLKRQWGQVFSEDAIRAAASYLKTQFRENDLLVRYASDEFVAVVPRTDRDQAESLKSRLQDELNHFRVRTRPNAPSNLSVLVGIAMFPEDGSNLDALIEVSAWRIREDAELQAAVRRGIKTPQASQ